MFLRHHNTDTVKNKASDLFIFHVEVGLTDRLESE